VLACAEPCTSRSETSVAESVVCTWNWTAHTRSRTSMCCGIQLKQLVIGLPRNLGRCCYSTVVACAVQGHPPKC